jgi:N-methylhydantoinase A/oxoprolinase/acetone carboxylase beta subunit
VVFPVAAGVMSALGLLASPLSFEIALTRQRFVRDLDPDDFRAAFAGIEAEAKAPLLAAGVPEAEIALVRRLDMRYHGQGHEIEVTLPPAADPAELLEALPAHFRERYEALYAFAFLEAPLVLTTWKVEARGPDPGLAPGYALAGTASTAPAVAEQARKGERDAFFEAAGSFVRTPVYDRYALAPGLALEGPALVEERESTVVIPPGDRVQVDVHLNLVAELGARGPDAPA